MTVTDGGRKAWLKLLKNATYAMIAVPILLTAITREFIPPLVIFMVAFIIGLVVLERKEKAGIITILVLSLAFFGTSVPFILDGLQHPESWTDFIPNLVGFLAAATSVRATIALLRSATSLSLATTIGRTALSIAAAGIAYSIVQSISVDDVAAQAGDIDIAAEDVLWSPDEFDASAGTVGIHIDNKDPFRHSFVIEELDVEEDLAQGQSARVEFTAEPGTYEFKCGVPGHDDMKGTLTVN